MVNTDLADEMVEPAQDHNAEQEQEQANDGSDNDDKPAVKADVDGDVADAVALSGGAVVVVKQEDDRVSSTSLYCSLPLSRDVQSIIDTFTKSSELERKKSRKLPCLYCERTFVADGLRQKHVERCHSVKQARRSSSRFQQGAAVAVGLGPTTLQCQFCDAFQPAAGDDDLNDLFRHLVGEHADRYFACVACRERFALKTHLDEHREEVHGVKRERADDGDNYDDVGVKTKVINYKAKTKDGKDADGVDGSDAKEAHAAKAKSELKTERNGVEQKELRGKKAPSKSTKLGTKRSARLQNKETSSSQPGKNSSASSTSSSSSSASSKKKGKVKDAPADPAEREIQKVAAHENPYPTFDAFYRVKKITDHSIDNLRITSLTFSDVFDQAFYTRIKCNIADNLQNHIDGKLFKNEESESRISNFEKSQAEIKPDENNYGCEISLHAATPVAHFLSPQLGDDPETQIEYGSKASKKKTKPDEVHYKYFTRRKYQASIREIKENRDLSKLDMWTQYVVKNRQQAIANTARSEKEKQDYKKGDEYRAKLQNEELNRILDRRGPFEDLKLEANKQAALDGNVSREARVEASCFIEDLLQRVFDVTHPEAVAPGVKTELTDAEIPGYLNLRRASPAGDAHVDRSDKITLICSSEETENFEAPQVSPRDKHALVELSGEWTRSRLFICAACGTRLANMRALIDHKNSVHQNVWCQHYEFVGKQGAYYQHLSIPGLGKMNHVEEYPVAKSWVRSAARLCTKCSKMCNTLGELHRHILECGEDWSWMLIRKKCKYRPYGAKTRRKRRGLLKRHETSKKENKEKKTYKRTERPREKPSDAETIQRMLANLPAKRATRKEMSLKDGFPKAHKKSDAKNAKKKMAKAARADPHPDGSATIVKRKIVAGKCNPVNNVRKSVRNLNKVISSSLIDNNIMVRRKIKAMQAQRATRARVAILPEVPVDLTEEQRAEEVKKKISLFKRVQKFRESVIKKRTKVSSSSAESVEKLGPDAGSGGRVHRLTESWRKTRSASNLTDTSSASSDKRVKSPIKKKLRANLGARLMRTLSMRRKNARAHTDGESSAGSANVPEKRKRFAGLKNVVKQLKVTNRIRKSAKNASKSSENEESTSVSSSNEHFLEGKSQGNTIRTISDFQNVDIRDNDNRPTAHTFPINSVSDNNNKLVGTAEGRETARETNEEKCNSPRSAPMIMIALADGEKDNDGESQAYSSSSSTIAGSNCKPFNETLKVCVSSASDTSQGDLSGHYSTAKSGELTSPPITMPSLSPLLGKSKNKLCKRAKGLNDCIAMLTSKLQCKDDPTLPTAVHSPTTKETNCMPAQQQPESPVVVVTPHDTSTEEQNVVIPEETVSENLESAKEPEAAPPSPVPITDTSPETAMPPSSQTAITINDLSSPVIEQDKENIEMEQKSLMPTIKQGYDASLDLIKRFEDIHPKEIRNGHLDHAKTDVINGFKAMPKKAAKQARKIGSNRKAPRRAAERTLVREQLNIARLEQDLISNDLERKIGGRRSLPQRKTKKAFVDLKIPEIKLKHRNFPKSAQKKNLPTILEESVAYGDLSFGLEIAASDKSQVISDSPQTPLLVHAVQRNRLAGKDELPVDLSLTRKPVVPEDAPVDLSTKKAAVDDGQSKVENLAAPAVGALVNFNLQSYSHAPLENEEVMLENKAIPQLSTPRDASSESEDELPLAALLKTKTSDSYKVDGRETTGDVIATPENVKSQIQEAFSKKVKKSTKDVNQNKSNRKKKSESVAPEPVVEPIVISDGENDNEASEAVVIPDEDLKAFANSSTLELKHPGANFPRRQSENEQLPKTTGAAIVANQVGRDLLTESVVCTPDLSLQSTNCLTPSRPDGEIDFEDVIPVMSISPSEAVKYKRNRIPGKTMSEIMADGVLAFGNNAAYGNKPKAKRGRKPKARTSVDMMNGSGKKTLSVCQLIDKFQCKAKQLDFRNPAPSVSKMADQQVPDVEQIADDATKNVAEECDIKEEVKVGPVPAETVVSEIASEIVSDQKSSVKLPTVKVRKVGRPKSKKGKKVAKSKKAKQQSLDSDGDVSLRGVDEGGQNVNISGTETTDAEEGSTEILEKSETTTENVNVNNLETQKDLEAFTSAENNSVVMSDDARDIPVETETVLNKSNLTNNDKESVQDKSTEPLLAPTTPVKAKSKRGRKPRVQKSFENVAEIVEETSKDAMDHVSEIFTPDCLKTRARKRKSDELNTTLDISTSIGENSDLNTSTSSSQSHAEAKSIAIYDFDEVDEGTEDNSKENMEELKTKSPKRTKRNGQSPGKAHSIIDEKQTKDVEKTPEEMSTPLKDVQNESFIQTPDLDDSVLGAKITHRFKVKKGKNSKSKKVLVEHVHYCDICNKQFGRLDSLNKHKRTLTHIAKLSEIEALEAEAKKRQSESSETERQEKSEENGDANDITERDAATPEREKCAAAIDMASEKIAPASVDDEKSLDALVAKDIERLDEANVLSPTSEFMRSRSQSDVTKNMLVASPFSLNTNNDALRLADIISDVLNKPTEDMETFADAGKQSPQEPKRYKSLGERKSFDSDSVAYTPTFNISPASTLINKSSSDEFLKNQLSLLENIIEENKASFEYIDEASAHSVQSIESEKSDRCPSDMSLVSDIKAGDSPRIICANEEDADKNFVKPNAHYEEISDDSMNNRSYEQERSRKTLNRDEELFLECCSLLKSSSEVSECKKSRAAMEADYNAKNLSHAINDCGKPTHQDNRKLAFNDDDFMSDSCPNTPIGNAYDDFSNSDTIKTDWSAKLNDKEYDNVSQSSMVRERRVENNFKAFNFKLDGKSDIDESSNSVDFRKNINAKFVGLMAEAMKGKSPRRKKQKEHHRRKSDITQTSIIDYAVQLTPKSSSNSADIFTDFTNDSKKVMTKGAMKVFEGLKVSIPTDEIDMNQVLDCSPTSKRLEIEESAKMIVKSKGLNFGNKLGLKVTKRRNARSRNVDAFLTDGDKLHDVYDFEETQDNTDLFSPASKLNFRNGCKLDDDLAEENGKDQSGKKNEIMVDMIESESESNNQDLDLFAAEVQSVNSFSTETESSTSVKPPTVSAAQENITKKKCQIMGRIFKNAIKAKVDGSKENTPVDDGDALENYIIGGPLEEVATPPPEKLPEAKERPKMSEKEMDLLFDKLLQSKDDQQTLKVGAKVSPIAKTPNSASMPEVEKDAKGYAEHHLDNEEAKEGKTKKTTPKSVKANRRRSRKHSESSGDEFNLTKSPKKRQVRKSKPRDNGINLDEEMKECMGVAGRKSQRKCTSGKQNVLIEYWSSDDSEFEAMLRLSMLESGDAEKTKEAPAHPPKTASTPIESEAKEANIDANVWNANEEEPGKETPTKVLTDDSLHESPVIETPTVVNPAPKNKKRSNSNTKRNDGREGKSRVPKSKHPRAPRSAQDEETLAANRRKRAAVDTLYYWSSSSEDDTENMIEVKSVRDEIDDEEDRPQHGWIVGDSPKKLVTLLAHAKGKKTNR